MTGSKTSVAEHRDRLWSQVRLQRALGFIFFMPFCGPLIFLQRYILGYKIKNVAECRAMYADLMNEKKPVIICSNHMTYLDSSLLIYAFSNHLRYWLNFRTLTWNLPAVEYSKNLFFRLVGLLAKCLFIDRKGFSTHQAYFQTCARLMVEGEPVMIFPEGRRSRTGRFDKRKLAYGVGKIVSEIPEVRVLCTYLRAQGQDRFSGFPKLGSHFKVEFKILTIRSQDQTRETTHRITEEIAACIQSLETAYFTEVSTES